jgi:hypothetical protein
VAATIATLNLGFLTILHEPGGYVGGYLVTNGWGRPLEFRLSTAVQPNRVQQILYGGSLQPYICADLIGKTLVEKTAVAAQLILTDYEPIRELRRHVASPVVWTAKQDDSLAATMLSEAACVLPAGRGRGPLLCHAQYPDDAPAVRQLLEQLDPGLDLAEPFGRIREAITEARKMGVMGRG